MPKIGLISDTHAFLDAQVFELFVDVEQIWHAGDFGTLEVSQELGAFKLLRGVYGNIDGPEIREIHPLHQRFTYHGVDVWMTHIGGYPGRYDRRVRDEIRKSPPDLFICGHSHILRVQKDDKLGLVHLNPGAAGKQGFHRERTVMVLTIEDGQIKRVQAGHL